MARTWFGGVLQETLRRHWVGDRWQLVSYFVDGLSRWSWSYISGTISFVTLGARRVLQFVPSTASAASVVWSGAGSPVDIEIVGKVRQASGTTARTYGLMCRGGGSTSARAGYMVRLSAGNALDVRKFSGSSVTTLSSAHATLPSSVTLNQTIGSWYRLRLRVVGNEILAKGWPDGQPEPAGWMVGGGDTSHTAARTLGFFVGAGVDTFQADDVVVIPTAPAVVTPVTT